MFEDLLKNIFEANPQLAKIMNSKQHKYSKDVIRTKHELGLNQSQMATMLNLSFNEYLELEFSSLDIPVSKYEEAFVRLSKINDSDIQAALNAPIDIIDSFGDFKFSDELNEDTQITLSSPLDTSNEFVFPVSSDVEKQATTPIFLKSYPGFNFSEELVEVLKTPLMNTDSFSHDKRGTKFEELSSPMREELLSEDGSNNSMKDAA